MKPDAEVGEASVKPDAEVGDAEVGEAAAEEVVEARNDVRESTNSCAWNEYDMVQRSAGRLCEAGCRGW